MLRRLLLRLRHLVGAARSRRDLDEEMRFHIEALEEDLIREGFDPMEARRQARVRFGSPERVHRRAREERGLAAFDELSRNLGLALRRTVRSPVFASLFVLTLGLCVAVGTTVFTFVDGVLWRPLPYPAFEQLALAVRYDPEVGRSTYGAGLTGRMWELLRDGGGPMSLAAYSSSVRGVSLSTDESASYVQQQRVGAGYFRTLGVGPALGREFTEAEDLPDGPPVAILSDALWSRAFGADRDALGRTIRLKGEPHTVVGVMPADFLAESGADVWTPLRPTTTGEGGGANYNVLVRVPRGMSLDEADARLATIELPRGERRSMRRFGLVPFTRVSRAGTRLPLLVVLLAAGLMIAVGCANLAGLQIARHFSRRTETATRQALGGGRGALVREALTENAALGLLGGILGLGIAALVLPEMEQLGRTHLGIWQDLGLDLRAIAASLGITALVTFGFAIGPLVYSGRADVSRAVGAGRRLLGGQRHAARKVLVVAQVATVTTLLFSAGLLLRSYRHLSSLDPGFDATGALTVSLPLDDARYAESARVNALFEESLGEIRRIPAVASAAVALTLPYERGLNLPFVFPGEEDYRLTNVVYATPELFSTMEIPVLSGRVFDDDDRSGDPLVAVANRAFADAYLPPGGEVGSAAQVPPCCGVSDFTVIGIVGNVQQSAGWGDAADPVWETPTLYFPAAQLPDEFFQLVHVTFAPTWVVRGGENLAAPVTQVLRRIDPDLAVARVATLEEVMASAFSWERLEAAFLAFVAAFALLLACVGIYGVVAHEVHERRGEMALRLAVGASIERAVWSTTRSGIALTAYGLSIGAVLGVGLAQQVMRGVIYGVRPFDAPALGGVLLVLLLVATVASLVPAVRVGRIDPAEALRAE